MKNDNQVIGARNKFSSSAFSSIFIDVANSTKKKHIFAKFYFYVTGVSKGLSQESTFNELTNTLFK